MFRVEPLVLSGVHVRLEPLGEAHYAALADTCTKPDFTYWPYSPGSFDTHGMASFHRDFLSHPGDVQYAILLANGEVVGSTSFHDVRTANRGLEIGRTWIAPPHRGTTVNPETKLLMLGHAFEQLGAIRVQIKTDPRNALSRRAIEKLGAQFEGILRHHMLMEDGTYRDTAMYAIVNSDWPTVKLALEQRLDALGQ